MDVFQETDYRKIVKAAFHERPNHGHGQTSRLAAHLGVNTTLVSQVLNGKRDFTEEQALTTSSFLGLNAKERHYFVLLVQGARAGSEDLRAYYFDQIEKARVEAKSLKGRVAAKKELTGEEQAIYYSGWVYAAVHTLVSIDGYQSSTSIARKLKLDEPLIRQVVERLVVFGLLNEAGGKLTMGSASTYVPPDSPHVLRHHQNWRQVATQKMISVRPNDFHFTAPFSISRQDFDEFRQELVDLLGRLYRRVEGTKPEELASLNIDFFKV